MKVRRSYQDATNASKKEQYLLENNS